MIPGSGSSWRDYCQNHNAPDNSALLDLFYRRQDFRQSCALIVVLTISTQELEASVSFLPTFCLTQKVGRLADEIRLLIFLTAKTK